MVIEWIKERVLTKGTGTILRLGHLAGYVRFSDVFAEGDKIPYSIVDGYSREYGEGLLGPEGEIERVRTATTLHKGMYVEDGAIPLSLSGKAEITVVESGLSDIPFEHGVVNKQDKSIGQWVSMVAYTHPGVDIMKLCKTHVINAVKRIAILRMQVHLPSVTDVDIWITVREILLSITPAARNATPAVVECEAIYQTTKATISDIKSRGTVEEVLDDLRIYRQGS